VRAEAGEFNEALKTISAVKPDIVVVDISLGDRSGIDLLKEIATRWPKLPVLVLSMHAESLYAERALHAGARGYIMKQEAPDRVLTAIRKILQGDVYVSESMTAQMLRGLTGARAAEKQSPVERLSDRELEVFQLIGKGFGTREIADKLTLSVKTVETHREHIKQKLQLTGRGDLLRFAVEWSSNQK